MSERKEYELTDAEFQELLAASRCSDSPVINQVMAVDAWVDLGERRGFDGLTVRPIPDKDERHFSAVEVLP